MALFSDLVGLTIETISGLEEGSEKATFKCTTGEVFEMYHDQDCCETVQVAEVIGDVVDLMGYPVVEAEESSNNDSFPRAGYDSWTWTFYKIGTTKGFVTIRWLGESNGYYSEDVSFHKVS